MIVIKILPPLTIELSTLQKGCSIIKEAFLTAKVKLFTNYPNSNFYQEKDDD